MLVWFSLTIMSKLQVKTLNIKLWLLLIFCLVADLPGLIPNSHKNKGLGIQFLKHAERCMALLFVIDASENEPWEYLNVLFYELEQFGSSLNKRPKLLIANKIDLEDAEKNVTLLKQNTELPVIPVSAKLGTNLNMLLKEIKIMYDKYNSGTVK